MKTRNIHSKHPTRWPPSVQLVLLVGGQPQMGPILTESIRQVDVHHLLVRTRIVGEQPATIGAQINVLGREALALAIDPIPRQTLHIVDQYEHAKD